MMALYFFLPKGQAPHFGICFDTKEEAESINYDWHAIIADWQALFEIEGVRIKLTIWLPGTQNRHTYTVYEWSRENLKKFLRECTKITSVEFFHLQKGQPHGVICLSIRKNEVWKINIRRINLRNYTPKIEKPLIKINEWPRE